jgi:hypothetical protein
LELRELFELGVVDEPAFEQHAGSHCESGEVAVVQLKRFGVFVEDGLLDARRGHSAQRNVASFWIGVPVLA